MTDKAKLIDDSKARVAYDLMRAIWGIEISQNTVTKENANRAYLLKLMHQCVSVVNGERIYVDGMSITE